MQKRIASLLRVKAPGPDEVTGLLRSHGTTVPTDGSTNYETGCLFQHLDGGIGTAIYVNEGSLTSSSFVLLSPAAPFGSPSIVAATGSAQLAGPVITGLTKVTGADGTKVVTLPTAVAGAACIIKNNSSSVLNVYPFTADRIDAQAVNTAIQVAAFDVVTLVAQDTLTWYSISPVMVSKTFAIALSSLKVAGSSASTKDALPDSPAGDGGGLGLADAAGSAVLGTSTSNTDATEHCQIDFVVPPDYVAGNDLTVRVKSYVSAVANATSDIDVVAKLVKGGALDATDLCVTAPIDGKAVVAVANNDFTIDSDAVGDVLAPGSILNIVISLQRDDTGGSTAGTVICDGVDILVPSYR